MKLRSGAKIASLFCFGATTCATIRLDYVRETSVVDKLVEIPVNEARGKGRIDCKPEGKYGISQTP